MIVVNRFQVDEADLEAVASFRGEVREALDVLRERPGFVAGTVGRNVDEPSLWLLVTTWENVGSYRRALSAYDVKVTAVPLLSRALDEPSAFEVVGAGGSTLNEPRVRELD